MRITRISSLLIAIACAAFAGQNTWTESSPVTTYVPRIYADPGNAAVAYAMTPIGFYRTTDGAATWQSIATAFPEGNVTAMAVDSQSTIWLATGTSLFSSRDRGDHWVLEAQRTTNINDIAAGDTIYLATDTGVTYLGDDGGWLDAKFPSDSGPMLSLAVSADAMYATSGSAIVGGSPAVRPAIYRSTDSGRTWKKATSEFSSPIFAGRGSNWVYLQSGGTVFVSTDGSSWKAMPAISGTHFILSMVVDGNVLYAATDGGLFAFRSGSWKRVGDSEPVHDVAVSGAKLYVAGMSGVLFANTGDRVFSRGTGLPGANSGNVAIAASDPDVRYADANGTWYRSADAGATWKAINLAAMDVAMAVAMAVDPTDPDIAYIPDGLGVRKTTDGGLTWNVVSPRPSSAVAIAPSNTATIYAAYQAALDRSADAGSSWRMGAPVPNDFYFYGYSYLSASVSLAVNPKNASDVVVSAYGVVVRSHDSGSSWDFTSHTTVRNIILDQQNPQMAYGIDTGVIRSDDGGKIWVTAGLSGLMIDSVASGGSRVCAQTSDGAVYCRENGGPWTGLLDGYRKTPLNHLAIDASGRHLASATDAGIWQYDIVGDDVHPQFLDNDVSRLGRALASQRVVVIPIAGTARGAVALFTTELTITNGGASSQRVTAVWLPAGGGTARAFQLDVASGSNTMFDASQRFGVDGVGTLAMFAENPNVAIDASARVWTHPYDDRAPLAEDVPGAADLAPRTTAAATGLRHDAQTRTNLGIVNLSPDVHAYTAQISGERKSGVITLTVPAYSLVQVAIPDGDYGALSISVSADSESRWVVYGSSIDRSTGEAHMALGH